MDTDALFIGLMSGTSLDGVDGVLARFSPDCTTLAHAHLPFPAALRQQFLDLQHNGPNEIEREAVAANALARQYASCVAQLLTQSGTDKSQICAIGAHGQTIRHRPELGFTRQSHNPALLAELSGIDVIADFRSRDIVAGGQGAPLVPAFHHAIFAVPGQTRALVNIGGISNISVLHADGHISGCDTGPGNVLLDAWIERQHGQRFDQDGAWAASGQIHANLLATLLREPFLALPAPKSTGRDLFHMTWLEQQLALHPGIAAQDVQATLAALTATSIAHMLERTAPDLCALYVCGGGAYNRHLLQQLAQALPGLTIAPSSALGVEPDQVEALAFAWLARQHVLRQNANLPAVTGAQGLRILGACYPA